MLMPFCFTGALWCQCMTSLLRRRTARRTTAALLACAAVTSVSLGASTLTGCSAGSTATQVGRLSASVVVGTTGAPASLDFTTTSGAAIPTALMGNIYEGLVRINEGGKVEPLLAQSWDLSKDRRTYTFHLREGVTFSNGSPFNAETAKFSIDRVRGDAWTNGIKSWMDVVENTEVIDPLTLVVTLERPSAEWLWRMGTLLGAMMSPDAVDKLATNPVGTGPYTLTHWAVGESISFAARSDYWGPKPKNDAAAIRYFSDAVAATNALQSGDIDVVWGMQAPELLDTLPEDISVEVGTTNSEVLLSMNNRRAPFNDVRVRQAVFHAVDRQAVINTVWEGYGTDTGGVPAPPTDPWYFEADDYPYDPQRARELLAEAGYDPETNPVKVTISVPSLPYAQATSELVYSQLHEVGIQVSLESTEFPAVWLNKVLRNHDYDMSIIGHVEARDIPNLFGDPDYYLGFDNADAREALQNADNAETEEEQVRYMREAVKYILADAAADTLMNLPNIVLKAPGVDGLKPNIVTEGLALYGISHDEKGAGKSAARKDEASTKAGGEG